MLLGALLMTCQSACLKVYQESRKWWDFSSISYIKPQTVNTKLQKSRSLHNFFIFFIILGKGHKKPFLFIGQCDDSVMTFFSFFFFSFSNKEKSRLANVSYYLILCYIVFHILINLLMNWEANSIGSQTQKPRATVKNKQILVTCTRIFRNFCKCIKSRVFIDLYYVGRSQEAGMLPQFYSLGSGAP